MEEKTCDVSGAVIEESKTCNILETLKKIDWLSQVNDCDNPEQDPKIPNSNLRKINHLAKELIKEVK